jgi:hypothetical protein
MKDTGSDSPFPMMVLTVKIASTLENRPISGRGVKRGKAF